MDSSNPAVLQSSTFATTIKSGAGQDISFFPANTLALTIDSSQNAKFTGLVSTANQADTLGVGVTTFAVTSNIMTITGDGGTNTIATITGANSGTLLTLIFVDGNVTITDDNTHAANSVDLSAAFTSADDTTLQLIYDGTSWYETSRSTN